MLYLIRHTSVIMTVGLHLLEVCQQVNIVGRKILAHNGLEPATFGFNRPFAFPTELCRQICRMGFKLLLILYSAIYSYNVTCHCMYHIIFITTEISPLMKLGELYAHIYKCALIYIFYVKLLCMHDTVTSYIVAILLFMHDTVTSYIVAILLFMHDTVTSYIVANY